MAERKQWLWWITHASKSQPLKQHEVILLSLCDSNIIHGNTATSTGQTWWSHLVCKYEKQSCLQCHFNACFLNTLLSFLNIHHCTFSEAELACSSITPFFSTWFWARSCEVHTHRGKKHSDVKSTNCCLRCKCNFKIKSTRQISAQ